MRLQGDEADLRRAAGRALGPCRGGEAKCETQRDKGAGEMRVLGECHRVLSGIDVISVSRMIVLEWSFNVC
ncbi:hypothetical protein MAIT1_01569 [Magnetofaba australis IT-1]|uniref:Uncharacterized protein n=1 Tax=Magnetofaba australis IT-1 TaxID=1434232 RepID=A0A1Y2K0M1_9PROT|nr:hypothetical protein MAIT1_01569 [Magnetofaba australis IT-1]